jgi:hypothetical protein
MGPLPHIILNCGHPWLPLVACFDRWGAKCLPFTHHYTHLLLTGYCYDTPASGLDVSAWIIFHWSVISMTKKFSSLIKNELLKKYIYFPNILGTGYSIRCFMKYQCYYFNEILGLW